MKSSPAQFSRRLSSGLLLAAFSAFIGLPALNLAGPAGSGLSYGQAPAFARSAGADQDQSEQTVVHSRSAQTPASPAVGADPGQPSSMTLKAGVSYTVPRGTAMKLKITQVPTTGMRLLQKDLEGNPRAAQLNDVICAQITEDIYVDGDRVIPEGTVFRGHVVKINDPRRVQRPGWVDIKFNELELPDQRIFRFKAEADNLEQSTAKTKLKATGMVAFNAFGGAVVGTMVAYQIFGPHYTMACKGMNLAAGAAGGAILAAGHAIMKKGHKAWLEPGDGLNLSIDTDMVMPALQAPTKHVDPALTNLPGLKIDVLRKKVVKNGVGGHLIRLDVDIYNGSNVELQAIDLYLVDTNKNKCPIASGPDFGDESTFLFHLEPDDNLRTTIYFDAEYPKLPHELVWFDHEHRRKVCYRQKLEM